MTMKPRYIVEAEALLGQKEIKGKLSNPVIKELFSDAGHPEVISDEVPWCAAMVGGTLARANQPKTGTLLARDYRSPSFLEKCVDHGKKPVLHSIGVMTRGNSSWQGHVGYVVDFDADFVWLLGGNQSDSVSVQKFPRKKFLGFATPKPQESDKTIASLVGDSRRLSFQRWMEWGQTTMAGAAAAVWTYSGEVAQLMKDNAGWVVLGVCAFGWICSRIIKQMSYNEYAQGRYLPKAQWER